MVVSLFDRSFSLPRGLRRKSTSKRNRRVEERRLRLAIDQLESRRALAITTPLSIGGVTVASFLDAPTGPGNLGDFVTVSIEGTKGTVIFNQGTTGTVPDDTDIQTIDIIDASPDFQLTFNGLIRTANPVPYGSDGIVQLGTITTTNVIRGINTVRGPATNVALSSPPKATPSSPRWSGRARPSARRHRPARRSCSTARGWRSSRGGRRPPMASSCRA